MPRSYPVRLVWRILARRWAKVAPPFRPSSEDLATYRTHLAGARPSSLLILGATPELRDLAASLGIARVTLVDRDRVVLAAMSRLVVATDLRHETRVVADWSTMELPPRSFGAIVGDLVWHWLRPSDQPVVADRIRRLLAPGGLFISRFRLIPDAAGGPPGRTRRRVPSAAHAWSAPHATLDRIIFSAMNTHQTREEVLAQFRAGFALVDEAHLGPRSMDDHAILVFRRD